MENILAREGFLSNGNPNEYVRGDWTVRLEDNLIEVFNNPDNGRGIYYCGPSKTTDLETILDEITNFDINRD